jgi:hypothetical protein
VEKFLIINNGVKSLSPRTLVSLRIDVGNIREGLLREAYIAQSAKGVIII